MRTSILSEIFVTSISSITSSVVTTVSSITSITAVTSIVIWIIVFNFFCHSRCHEHQSNDQQHNLEVKKMIIQIKRCYILQKKIWNKWKYFNIHSHSWIGYCVTFEHDQSQRVREELLKVLWRFGANMRGLLYTALYNLGEIACEKSEKPDISGPKDHFR